MGYAMIEQFSHNEEKRINKHEHREMAMWDAVLNPDLLSENTAEGQPHPTPEQLFIREAISKALMHKQREVWEMYAYDQLTFAEIGRKLRIDKSSAKRRIQTIEKQIREWCEGHMGVYQTLKEAERGY